MNLENLTELELCRLLKSLILDRKDISHKYREDAFELINQFNLMPSSLEFDEIIKLEKKTLDKLYDKILDDTQSIVRKIKVFYEQEVSKYNEIINSNFYQLSIDKFIDYAYEVSGFLEDNSLDLVHIGIVQSNIDKYNAQLFDLKKLNLELNTKIEDWKTNRQAILTKIINKIKDLQADL